MPSVAAFTSLDPERDGVTSPYAAFADDPVDMVDPTGAIANPWGQNLINHGARWFVTVVAYFLLETVTIGLPPWELHNAKSPGLRNLMSTINWLIARPIGIFATNRNGLYSNADYNVPFHGSSTGQAAINALAIFFGDALEIGTINWVTDYIPTGLWNDERIHYKFGTPVQLIESSSVRMQFLVGLLGLRFASYMVFEPGMQFASYLLGGRRAPSARTAPQQLKDVKAAIIAYTVMRLGYAAFIGGADPAAAFLFKDPTGIAYLKGFAVAFINGAGYLMGTWFAGMINARQAHLQLEEVVTYIDMLAGPRQEDLLLNDPAVVQYIDLMGRAARDPAYRRHLDVIGPAPLLGWIISAWGGVQRGFTWLGQRTYRRVGYALPQRV